MYGAGGSGKSSMLSMTAYRAAYEWLRPAQPLLFVRFCGTTPNSTSLGPLLKSICQQISYTFLLPFQEWHRPQTAYTDKKNMGKYLRISSYIRKPFLILFYQCS
jgi:hypothetical protein